MTILDDLHFFAITSNYVYSQLSECQVIGNKEVIGVCHHDEVSCFIVDLVAHSSSALNAHGATIDQYSLGRCGSTRLSGLAEVFVVTHVTKHTVVTRIHTTNRAPAHFTWFGTFVGGRSFADALVDEDEVGVLLWILLHHCLASIDVCLVYSDGGSTIRLVVEIVVILVRDVFADFVEEPIESEEFREVFFCYFATESSKSQEVGFSVGEVDRILAELVEQFVEEGGFVSQFYVVQPQLPVHACAVVQVHVEPRLVVVEAVEKFLRILQTAHARTAFPDCDVRPEVVGAL